VNGPLTPIFALAHLLIAQTGTPLTESDAVKTALVQSPKLKAARFESQAAQAQTDRDKPTASPSVTTAAEGRLQGPRVTFPRNDGGDETVVPERYGRLELNVEQIFYHAGAGAARERYDAQTRANADEFRRQQNDVVLEVRRAYYQLLSADAMAAVARESVELARKHQDLTRLMLQAGSASERDVKASDADLAEAEQGQTKADNGAALARANLNRVMGRDPSTTLETAPVPPMPTVPASPDEGIAAALRRRPEIIALENGIAAARAGASLASAQDQPALAGRATAAAQTPTGLTASRYFAAGLLLTWNPFDTARTRADVREARARVSQLEAQLEDAKLGIRVDVEKAWRDMREAASRIETSGRQVAAARAALDISELRYQSRSATQLEVSGALFNVNKALANQAQARFDLYQAAADYAHATAADVPTK
jgi:outer membrane protein